MMPLKLVRFSGAVKSGLERNNPAAVSPQLHQQCFFCTYLLWPETPDVALLMCTCQKATTIVFMLVVQEFTMFCHLHCYFKNDDIKVLVKNAVNENKVCIDWVVSQLSGQEFHLISLADRPDDKLFILSTVSKMIEITMFADGLSV